MRQAVLVDHKNLRIGSFSVWEEVHLDAVHLMVKIFWKSKILKTGGKWTGCYWLAESAPKMKRPQGPGPYCWLDWFIECGWQFDSMQLISMRSMDLSEIGKFNRKWAKGEKLQSQLNFKLSSVANTMGGLINSDSEWRSSVRCLRLGRWAARRIKASLSQSRISIFSSDRGNQDVLNSTKWPKNKTSSRMEFSTLGLNFTAVSNASKTSDVWMNRLDKQKRLFIKPEKKIDQSNGIIFPVI